MIPHPVKHSVLNPTTKKKEEKTEWKTNVDKREDFIKKFGIKKFNEVCKVDPKWAELQDIPIPNGFNWLWYHFLQIWRHCESDLNGNKIFTPRQITDYCECFSVEMTARERRQIMMFEEWAEITISKLHKDD